MTKYLLKSLELLSLKKNHNQCCNLYYKKIKKTPKILSLNNDITLLPHKFNLKVQQETLGNKSTSNSNS